jgi:hypothetical protein
MRTQGRMWITSAAVVTCLASFATACSTSDGAGSVDPLARLESLGAAWLKRPATVTYSTMEHEVGSATSVHQCLRQVVETSVETAIRMCNPKGEMTLAWDPPERWRMELSNHRGSSTLLTTPDGAYRCHQPVDGTRACAPTSATELTADGPFGSILLPPSQILDMLGPDAAEALTARPERQIAGIRAECFSAVLPGTDGEANQANWCYSKDGILLRSLIVSTDTGTTMLEATEVSTSVSEADFDLRHAVDGNDSEVASIEGTWVFDALTGVRPSQLPPGSVPDNRHDIVIDETGSFHWGSWSGHVEGSGNDLKLFVEQPRELGRRFAEYQASVSAWIAGGRMKVWLPDLGQDRDVDFGTAVEDIDSPDMAFRRLGV